MRNGMQRPTLSLFFIFQVHPQNLHFCPVTCERHPETGSSTRSNVYALSLQVLVVHKYELKKSCTDDECIGTENMKRRRKKRMI